MLGGPKKMGDFEPKKKWQRVDLNRRPRAYELASGKATSGLLSRPLASFLTEIIEGKNPQVNI
jgi:N-formylglutamate amidohydrolase